MANKWQKLLYHLSAFSPILITGSMVWSINESDIRVFLLCLLLCCIIILAFRNGFSVLKKQLQVQVVHATDYQCKDAWTISYIVSYLFPLASLVVDELNLNLCLVLSVLVIAVLQFSVQSIPNPLLLLCGYHVYSVSTEQGNSGVLFISRRKISKKQAIRKARHIFDNLLLDAEE